MPSLRAIAWPRSHWSFSSTAPPPRPRKSLPAHCRVMGTRSFGKGSVQTIVPLSGKGALRITTDLYYTPSGRSIQAQGIAPDVAVVPPAEQQVSGLQLSREADLRGAFKPSRATGGSSAADSVEAKPTPFNPKEDGLIDPLILGTDKDHQL